MIDHFDHIVLSVADVDRSVDFYERTLKMEPVKFVRDQRALAFGAQRITLQHIEDEPLHTGGIKAGGFCLVTYAPLDNVIDHLKSENVVLIDGPLIRDGAQGLVRSVCFNDPDGNVVEVSSYADAAKVIK